MKQWADIAALHGLVGTKDVKRDAVDESTSLRNRLRYKPTCDEDTGESSPKIRSNIRLFLVCRLGCMNFPVVAHL